MTLAAKSNSNGTIMDNWRRTQVKRVLREEESGFTVFLSDGSMCDAQMFDWRVPMVGEIVYVDQSTGRIFY